MTLLLSDSAEADQTLVLTSESTAADVHAFLEGARRSQPLFAQVMLASEVAWRAGDAAAAIEAMELAVTLPDADATTWMRLASFCAEDDRLEAAERACLEAGARDPSSDGPLRIRLHIANRREDPDAAWAALHKLDALVGAPPDVFVHVAAMFVRLDRIADAQRVLQQLHDGGHLTDESLALEFELLFRSGDPSGALRIAERACRLWPASAQASLRYARLLIHLGLAERAIPILERSRELTPGDAALAHLLATALQQRGSLQAALQAALAAVNLDQTQGEYWYTVAILADAMGYTDQAGALMERAIAALPDRPDLLLALAQIVARTGEYDRALAALAQAEAVDPTLHGLRDLRIHYLSNRHQAALTGGPRTDVILPLPRARDAAAGTDTSFGALLVTQWRVLSALILRELQHRTIYSRFGIVSVLLPPAVQIAALGIVLSLFNDGRPPLGQHLFFFYSTGVLPFYLFIHVVDHCQNQFVDNLSVLQVPIINRLDLIWALAISELLIGAVTTIVTFGTFALMDYGPVSDNQFEAILAYLTAWIFGLGIGLISAVMNNLSRVWVQGWIIVQRFLYVASGIFFIPQMMPGWLREPLTWNPLLQIIEWFRTGFFEQYEPPWLSKGYTVGISLSTVLIGLMLERALRSRMKTQ